jgi:hypothetical protein
MALTDYNGNELRLKKAQVFTTFWSSPWGAAKGEMWEAFTHDMAWSSYNAAEILRDIATGNDEWLDWEALSSVVTP